MDLKCHNLLLVRLRDGDAGWKKAIVQKASSNRWNFKRRLKTFNESATLTKSGRLFQIVEIALNLLIFHK